MRNTKTSPSRIYVFMAIFFLVTTMAGFVPTSIGLIARVTSGQQPMPPWVLHVHAASMYLWLFLLLVQSLSMYRKKPKLHKKLGLTSLILAPCILLSMYGVEMMNIELNFSALSNTDPEQHTEFMQNISSLLLIHGASYLLFPTFYLWAILVRSKDGESHKRMMILATLVLLIPGIGRLLSVTRVLPDFGLNSIDARHFYLLILIAPALIYDVVKQRTPHRSYIIGTTLLGIWMITAHFLWDSSWWAETGPKLLGIE